MLLSCLEISAVMLKKERRFSNTQLLRGRRKPISSHCHSNAENANIISIMSFSQIALLPLKRIPIKVHCWGGFGSQLFACVVARRLNERFPQRKIVVVFHSSGVTARHLEVPQSFLQGSRVTLSNDFQGESKSNGSTAGKSQQNRIKTFIILLLRKLRFLVRLNSEMEFRHIRYWSLEVRGHYTQLSLTENEIDWVISSLGIDLKNNLSDDVFSVHFRLGDLMKLSTKSFIPVERVTRTLLSVPNVNTLSIYSDSSEQEVRMLIADALTPLSFKVSQLPTLQVIKNCVENSYFLGTNSKISLWIALIRCTKSLGKATYLPHEMSLMLGKLVPPDLIRQKTISY